MSKITIRPHEVVVNLTPVDLIDLPVHVEGQWLLGQVIGAAVKERVLKMAGNKVDKSRLDQMSVTFKDNEYIVTFPGKI